MTRLLTNLTLLIVVLGISLGDQHLRAQSADVIGNSGRGKMSVLKSPKFDPMKPAEQGGVENAVVKEKTKYIAVIGQVGKPGVYEFVDSVPSFEELIGKYAGGLTPYSRHEFYVFRQTPSGLVQQQLDPRRHALFEFEDGDILLAETPVKYYQNLAIGGGGPSLKDLHATTQIALLNVLDRPVLFSVKPENARLDGLLELMSQDPSAMAGVEYTEPPHAQYIPVNAGVPPNAILSGSIMTFNPKAIVRGTLPELPSAIRVVTSNKLKVASSEFTVPSFDEPQLVTHSQTESLGSNGQKKWNLPSVSTEDPKELPGEGTKPNNQLLPNDLESEEFTELHNAFEEMRKSDSELVAEVSDVVIPESQDENPILSSQQTTYFVSFLVVVTLFGIAWYIRQRQVVNGFKRYATAEKRYSNYIESSLVHETGLNQQKAAQEKLSEATADEKEDDEDQKTEKETALEESDSSETNRIAPNLTPAAPTVLSERLNLYEKNEEQKQEVETADMISDSVSLEVKEEQAEKTEPTPQIESENQEPVADTAPSADSNVELEQPEAKVQQPATQKSAFVPHSIMDNPLMRELLEEHARLYLESSRTDKVTPPAADEKPVEESPKPAPAQKIRIDQAHPAGPQPLFPIVWKNADTGEQEAKVNRYRAGEEEHPAAEQTDRVDPHSSPVAGSHFKMKDPESVDGNEDDAKLFDRVFRAVMRERQK